MKHVFIDGLIVDNFAGGGGASTGMEAAVGRPIDIAINHDPEAVAMHAANHPCTVHYCQSVWKADPLDVTGGRKVGLAWFSPDCKHFSKAKGGKPVEKHIRDLAWVVIHWAKRVKPAVIMLENVEEFRTWGPLGEDGKPDPAQKGVTFDLWVRQLKRLGYKVDWRELRACDYGAPTSRKRLFLIARCDGLPIVWPAPTHGKAGSPDVVSGKLKPWRTAAEIVNWALPCPSIFDRDKELAENTNRRIAHGVVRHVINAAKPFYIPVTNATWAPTRADSIDLPLRTMTTAKGGEFAIVSPTFVGCGGRRGQSGPVDPRGPYPTNTTKADACLVAGTLVQTGYGEREGQAPRALDPAAPIGAMVSGAKHAAVSAFLSHFYTSNTNGGQGDPREPTKTLMAGGGHHAVVAAHMEQANTGMVGHAMSAPVSTIVGRGTTQRLIETTLLPADALPPELMARAVKVAAFLIKYYGNEVDGHGLDKPLGSATTKERFAVVTVTIDAATYVIVDIGMRMLTPPEMFAAQGFPPTYDITPIVPETGKPLTKTAQTRMCGNSVCPDMSEALTRANFPEVEDERIAA